MTQAVVNILGINDALDGQASRYPSASCTRRFATSPWPSRHFA
jgi:hypothetical protein